VLGKQHDKAIIYTTPIAGAVSFYFQPDYFGFVMAAHLFGGYMLSPDLDTYSEPYKRWNLIWNLNYWWLYKKRVSHRSIISHGLLVGTAVRVLYLIAPFVLILHSHLESIMNWCVINKELVLWILAGLEFSAMVHVGCDRISDFQNWLESRNKKGSNKRSPVKKSIKVKSQSSVKSPLPKKKPLRDVQTRTQRK
jgi:uncharacterized metal-binding protein